MLEAVEQTSNLRARDPEVPADATGKPVPSESELAAQNQRAMRELQNLMGGLGS